LKKHYVQNHNSVPYHYTRKCGISFLRSSGLNWSDNLVTEMIEFPLN
jgi:hypothetical protein